MNPELQAWAKLREHAAGRIRPGFADRVIVAARERAVAAPSFFAQFAFSAATAALCFGAVAFFASHNGVARADSQSDWQEIASASVADAGLAP